MEMEEMSKKDLLAAVDKAIYTIAIGGQSYKIGSRSLTRADLKTLYMIKNDLTAQVARENSTELFEDTYAAVFEGR